MLGLFTSVSFSISQVCSGEMLCPETALKSELIVLEVPYYPLALGGLFVNKSLVLGSNGTSVFMPRTFDKVCMNIHR